MVKASETTKTDDDLSVTSSGSREHRVALSAMACRSSAPPELRAAVPGRATFLDRGATSSIRRDGISGDSGG